MGGSGGGDLGGDASAFGLTLGPCQVCGVGAIVASGCTNPACEGGGGTIWSWQNDRGGWTRYSPQDTRKIELANARGQVTNSDRRSMQALSALNLTVCRGCFASVSSCCGPHRKSST